MGIALVVLAWALAALAVLLIIACIRAVAIKARRRPGSAPPVNATEEQRYARHLSALIQCPTTHTGGAEQAAAFEALLAMMRRQYPRTFAALEDLSQPDALLLRWPGGEQGEAMLLMAHCDVVAAPGEWLHPPFAGAVADGRVWGRGAMDDKGALCALFEAVEALLAEGFTPARDVYLCSSRNEELMGAGAVQVRDALAKRGVRLAIVLDEGSPVGTVPLPGLHGSFAQLGLAEKGCANVRFTARSPGGHASVPPRHSPLARLAALVHHVETRPPFKTAIGPTTRAIFAGLAPHMRFGWRLMFGNLWLFAPVLLWLLPRRSPHAAAMLRTTAAFTMVEGSATPNVLPQHACVTANLRFAEHQPMAPSLAALERLAARYGLEMEVLYANDVFPAVDTEGDAYRFLRGCARQVFPEAPAVPFIMLAGTDARHFAAQCRCTLRFLPLALSDGQRAAMHGMDENIDTAALARAVSFYAVVLRQWRPVGA